MKVYDINGLEVEMGTIGDLAEALGRGSQTVRKWERKGTIPPTRFRDETNKRLYPKQLIDKLVEISKEEDITQGVSFSETDFKERAYKAFEEVENEILG